MKKKKTLTLFLYVFVAALVSIFLIGGCSSSDVPVTNPIQGTVTDANTGVKLQGVKVTVENRSTLTDANGHYVLEPLIGGYKEIKAELTGYNTYTAKIFITSWQPSVYDIKMTVPTEPGTQNVMGTVLDGTWNPLPLAGVTVTVDGKSAVTDSEGKYEIKEISAGSLGLTGTKDEYVPYNTDVDVAEGQTTVHDFIMYLNPDARIPFTSDATNFTDLTLENTPKIYVKKKIDGSLIPGSLQEPGVLVPGNAFDASISSNGRYVVYSYFTAQQQPQPQAGVRAFEDVDGVYVCDLTTGESSLVSKSSTGELPNNNSFATYLGAVSADGRYIVYSSRATNLVENDTNGNTDIFLFDRETETTSRISVGNSGDESNNGCRRPAISADGRFIVFESYATNLVDGFTIARSRIYLYDQQTKTLAVVSTNSAGEDADGNSWEPRISADGRYVVFTSIATNFVDNVPAETVQIYRKDMTTGELIIVSVNSSGTIGDSDAYYASVSGDGRYVAFTSDAANLVDNDTNNNTDIFVRDVQSGTTTRASVSSSGTEGDNGSWESLILADGSAVVFDSTATNLVDGDDNNNIDVFIHYLSSGETRLISETADGTIGDGLSYLEFGL